MSIITPELLTELLRGSLLPIAGAAGQSVVIVGGEWIKLWQMKNAVSVGQKAVEFLEKRGFTNPQQLRDITTKFGILYIEGASVEDQPELQELWAKLLANAVDPIFPAEKLSNAFFDIIKGLDPSDVILLNYLNEQRFNNLKKIEANFDFWKAITKQNTDFKSESQVDETMKTVNKKEFSGHYIRQDLSMGMEDYSVSIHNLIRLQCIMEINKPSEINNQGELIQYLPDEELVAFTPLGVRFIDACIA
jgi:hypothetical protein